MTMKKFLLGLSIVVCVVSIQAANVPPAPVPDVRKLTEEEMPEEPKLDVAYVFTVPKEDMYKGESSPYANWKADFYVSFDKDVAAGTLVLSGQYDAWNEDYWLGIPLNDNVKAGEEIALVGGFLGSAIVVNYKELCNIVKSFKCGVKNYSVNNAGTKMTVTLRLTKDGYDDIDISTTETMLMNPNGFILTTDTGSKMDGYPYFDQTYTFATNGTDNASSPYWSWAANFLVSFDKKIPAKTLKLATRFTNTTTEWDQSIKGDDLQADTEYELDDAGTYGEFCQKQQLDFALWAYDNTNTGTTMTVWFKLTNGTETVKQKIAEYTFPNRVKVVIRPSGVTEETAPYAVEIPEGSDYYVITNHSCTVKDTVLTMTGLTGSETIQLNYLCNFVSNANAMTKFYVMSYPKKTTKGEYRYLPAVIPDTATVCKGFDPKTGVFNTALSTNAMAYPISVLNETNKFTSWWTTYPKLSYVVMRCTNMVEQDWATVSSIEYRTESYETHFFETKGSGERYRPDSFYKVQVSK